MIYLLRLANGDFAVGEKVEGGDQYKDVYYIDYVQDPTTGKIAAELLSLMGPFGERGQAGRTKFIRGYHVLCKIEAPESLRALYSRVNSSIEVVSSVKPLQ